MHEWMKDTSITNCFSVDFSKFSEDDCMKFINDNIAKYANPHPNDISFAITDETNIYKGTISLKHIDYKKKCAEFAIVLVGASHGSGLAKDSFDNIMKYAFNDLALDFVYFSCKKDNIIANKFYAKTSASKITFDELYEMKGNYIEGYTNNNLDELLWYVVKK